MTARNLGRKCERDSRTGNAADWYDKEREGLGKEFAGAVEIAIDLIEEDIRPLSPMPGKSGSLGVKRLILKRFPYDIVVIEGELAGML